MGEKHEKLGRYMIRSQIGSGGMGTVYRALDPELGRDVAIKVVRPGIRHVAVVLSRFRREALALARLSHPGIVRVFDFGKEGPDLFLVMELLEGEPLDRHRENPGRFDPKEFLDIFTQVADALAVLHGQGSLHRDIKPANILVGVPQRGAVLTDFGLAWLEDDVRLTQEGGVLGTGYYMAPEQVDGQRATPASDVYALGATMFEYVTRRVPFGDVPSAGLLAARMSSDLPPLASAAPDVPAAIAAVIDRAVRRNPAERYATGRELHRALTRTGREPGSPTGIHRVQPTAYNTIVQTPPRPKPRRTWPALLAGAVTLLAVTLAILRPGQTPAPAPAVVEAKKPATLPPPEALKPVALSKPGSSSSPQLAAEGHSLLALWVDPGKKLRASLSPDDGRTWQRPGLDGQLQMRLDSTLALAGFNGRFHLLYQEGGTDVTCTLMASAASADGSAWTTPVALGTSYPGRRPSLSGCTMADGTERLLAAWQGGTVPTESGSPLYIAWGDARRGAWMRPAVHMFRSTDLEEPMALLTPEEGTVVWRKEEDGAIMGTLQVLRSRGPGKQWAFEKEEELGGYGWDRDHLAGWVHDDRIYLLWSGAALGRRPQKLAISSDGLRTFEHQRSLPEDCGTAGWSARMVAREDRIWLAWTGDGKSPRTWSASRDAGRTWKKEQVFGPPVNYLCDLGLALDGTGRPWLCWGDASQQVRAMPLE